MTIKDLPKALRPREKLLAHGPAALADAELLALLLRTGTRGMGVLDMADALLTRFKGFGGLLHCSAEDIKGIKGLGPAKRAEVSAVLEISRRALAQQLSAKPAFDTVQRVKDYAALQLGGLSREVFAVMFLDAQHRLIAWQELFQGTLSQTSVYPRELVRRAMEMNAAAVILAHNHPSGVAEPSRADEFLTKSIQSALALVDVRVLDHMVVGQGEVVSLAERGLM